MNFKLYHFVTFICFFLGTMSQNIASNLPDLSETKPDKSVDVAATDGNKKHPSYVLVTYSLCVGCYAKISIMEGGKFRKIINRREAELFVDRDAVAGIKYDYVIEVFYKNGRLFGRGRDKGHKPDTKTAYVVPNVSSKASIDEYETLLKAYENTKSENRLLTVELKSKVEELTQKINQLKYTEKRLEKSNSDLALYRAMMTKRERLEKKEIELFNMIDSIKTENDLLTDKIINLNEKLKIANQNYERNLEQKYIKILINREGYVLNFDDTYDKEGKNLSVKKRKVIKGDKIVLRWNKPKGRNVSKYIIQRKILNSNNWEILSIVNAQKHILTNTYSITEDRIGAYQYRIKIRTKLGNELYSNLIKVDVLNDLDILVSTRFRPKQKVNNNLCFSLSNGDNIKKLTLYETTGSRLFIIDKLNNNCWDGRYNQNYTPEGMYYYEIEVRTKESSFYKYQGKIIISD
ncbi:MAG: gliding motility-associated C-terminal domain-containing protein [Saprospiraceae bacterium]